MRLTALAPAKINLCLFVGPVRADGRHELVTVFESLSLADTLTLTELPGGAADEVVCPGVEGENLVAAAIGALRSRGWDGPAVRIEVSKRIPVAAGLGGGSADAAAALRLAVELAPGRPEEVAALAAELGADVPGQVAPGLVLGTGAGEVVEPLHPLAPHGVLVVHQPFGLSTAEVYAESDRLGLGRSAGELSALHERVCGALTPGGVLTASLLVNDLQPAALALRPEIAVALEASRSARGAADHVMVSGSGPTVVGLFWGADGAERAEAAAGALRGRFPAVMSAVPVSAEFGLPQEA